MNIIITGDFVVNKPLDNSQISKEVIELFSNSDFNIVNLEAPITNSESKILKTGPHLKSDSQSTLSILKKLNVNLVTLANNHILDYDEQGVLDTLEICSENGIHTVGAGLNIKEASKTFYLDTAEGKVAIINIAENEWASATDTSAGANGMDLIDDIKAITEAKFQSDFVFVIVHGGHEYYNLPSPRMQKQYRFYIDYGADIVVGHHTHCISGMEVYKNKPIYYSLGNFLFTKASPFEDWYSGIVLNVEIQNNEFKTKIIFVNQERNSFNLKTITGSELSAIQDRFDNYSLKIRNDLLSEWNEFIERKNREYSSKLTANIFIKSRYLYYILSKLNISLTSNKGKAILLNIFRCEAHSDLTKAIIKRTLIK